MNEKNYDIKCKKTKVTYSRIIFRQSYLKSMENGLTKFRRFIYQNKVQTYHGSRIVLWKECQGKKGFQKTRDIMGN